LVGNFPQAFTHLAVVRTAARLSGVELPKLAGPVRTRIEPPDSVQNLD
jgi:hypothetical protein